MAEGFRAISFFPSSQVLGYYFISERDRSLPYPFQSITS